MVGERSAFGGVANLGQSWGQKRDKGGVPVAEEIRNRAKLATI